MNSSGSHPTSAPIDSQATSQQDLFRLLQEWRRVTELEAAAICRNDWAGVAEHQGQKRRLRDTITLVQQHRHAQPASAPARGEAQRFKALLAEVVALERRNADVLSAKRQQRQEELYRLNQTARQLHGVRRAYVTSSQPCWQSYS